MGDVVLYRRLVVARIRSDWQYRTSFLIFMLAQALITTLDLLAILFLLDLIPSLGDWSTTEVLFLYAMSSVPFGLADLTLSSVQRVADYVQEGEFDRILLRPTSALLQLSALEFELRRVGRLIPSVGTLAWAMANTSIPWTPGRLAFLALSLASATLIYGALWILTSSLSFWAVASNEATNSVTYGGQTAAQYPLHLYPGWIRAVLGWAIPLAFVAYLPTIHLLGAPNPLGLPDGLAYAAPVVAAITLTLAMLAWRTGIRHYQSTGS